MRKSYSPLQKTLIAHSVFALMHDKHSMRQACLKVGVATSTLCLWIADDKELNEQYAHARDALFAAWSDEINEIADDGRNDYMEKLDRNGRGVGYVLNGEHVQRSKLRIESRKWLLSKLASKKFGDRVNLDHGTQEGDPIRQLIENISGTNLKPKP